MVLEKLDTKHIKKCIHFLHIEKLPSKEASRKGTPLSQS